MPNRPRLDSWKEIARYLGRDVRTVIRWERHRGLPVHRVPGGKVARVFAYPHELDAWLARGQGNGGDADNDAAGDDPPISENATPAETLAAPTDLPRRALWRRASVAITVLIIVVIVGLIANRLITAAGPPQELRVVGQQLLALDATGKTRWTYQAATPFVPWDNRWLHMSDLDTDGNLDVVASIERFGSPLNEHLGELLRFNSNGRLLWSVTPVDRVAFRGSDYAAPWVAADMVVYDVNSETRISWTLHHFTWFPSLLITFNPQGKRLATFVNSGWIYMTQPTSDARHLVVAGVTNAHSSYFVAVLDARNPSGHSPEPEGSATECMNCPTGDPLLYLVFPRSEVSRLQPFPGDGPSVVTFADGKTEVHTLDSTGPNIASTIYQLTSDFTISRVRFSDAYWEWHRRLEAEGKLHHSPAECPERRTLTVQTWTRSAGWQKVTVAAE